MLITTWLVLLHSGEAICNLNSFSSHVTFIKKRKTCPSFWNEILLTFLFSNLLLHQAIPEQSAGTTQGYRYGNSKVRYEVLMPLKIPDPVPLFFGTGPCPGLLCVVLLLVLLLLEAKKGTVSLEVSAIATGKGWRQPIFLLITGVLVFL